MSLQVGLRERAAAKMTSLARQHAFGEHMLAVYTPNMLFEPHSSVSKDVANNLPHCLLQELFLQALWHAVPLEHDRELLPCCAGRSLGFSLADKYDNGQAIAGEARIRKQKRKRCSAKPR
jgi:hypothetical protein